jgi:superfamily I DNA/RNA helicase
MTAVSKMMPSLDIFGARRDMTKVDVQIRLRKCTSLQDEVKYTYETALENAAEGDTSVILLPFHDDIKFYIKTLCEQSNLPDYVVPNNQYGKPDYNAVNRFLNDNNIKLEYVGNNYGSFQNAEKNRKVIMMTYHSAKGMDFRHVFLPFMNSSTKISANPEVTDETLFMVALTRSNRNLYLTYSGNLHPLVQKFRDSCSEISTDALPQNNAGNIFGW